MVVYLNTMMKWYGVIPQSNLYFDKSDLSPNNSPPGLYLGNPHKTNMRWIKVNQLKNLMKKRNVDVEVVDLPSILGSTEYKRELFLIEGYAQRGKISRKDTDGLPEPVYPCGEGKKAKNKMIHFLNTQFYLNRGWVDTLTMFYVAKIDASLSILQAI
jgi:hypothetical protein